ncbi:hypothetical protein MUN89_19325 [Halobacillus salinarum]|uniref:Uncharacterized protein n=1 Tax=Halobacillus salinarum TaxID=2932257 RepID=A0ABY4EK38_9BACI|nr:hypothetical protein [Halobacillus salinarum]UOQ43994.1 hypothetical protein MUN89_19325 [Halobacillus salinarum]
MIGLQIQSFNKWYDLCPVCNGYGKYEEYDDSKANMIVDHYQRMNHARGTEAWKLAVEETSYEKECSACHGNGNILNDEGKQMYQLLKQYA